VKPSVKREQKESVPSTIQSSDDEIVTISMTREQAKKLIEIIGKVQEWL
jgi:hypothetical protein